MTPLLPRVLLCFIFHSILIPSLNNAQNVPKELAGEGIGNKVGVRARLSQKGINYIAAFFSDLLAEDVVGFGAKWATTVAEEAIQQGKARLTELDVVVQKRSRTIKVRTEAPRQTILEIPGTAFTCKAKLSTKSNNETKAVEKRGKAQFVVTEATLFLNVSALRHAQGSSNFRIERCQLRVDKPLSVSLEMDGATEKPPTLERELLEDGQGIMERLICGRTANALEERINRRFALLPTKMSLSNLNGSFIVDEVLRRMRRVRRQRKATEPSDGTTSAEEGNGPDPELLTSFNVSRADVLFLDYSMVADFRADQRGLEMDSSGEVSLRGRGGTPFGPLEVSLPTSVSEEHMLQMLVSDFMPNSLLYHGHTIGLFNARIDPKTPHFGSIMRTSCSASTGILFCLGDFFPTLRRVHPDRQLALLFSTIQSPVMKFRPQSLGGITFSLIGRIVMMIARGDSEEEKVAEMEINVDAHMKIRLSSKMVRPRVALDHIKLKTLSPGILAQEELDRSVLLAREVLQRMVNDILKAGIPIPLHPLMQLHKPKVKVVDRAILLLTNVSFNEPLLRQIASADMEKRGAAARRL
uniref:BPI2 domain-containing protein n=1 Tax=Globodera pallida TaxID=36090 RepID=A0A183BNZ0_GLOPA